MSDRIDWPETARVLHRRYLEVARRAQDQAKKATENQLRGDALTAAAAVWREVADLVVTITDEASARRVLERVESEVTGLRIAGQVQPWFALLRALGQLLQPPPLEIPDGVSPREAAVSFLRQALGDDIASNIWEQMESDADWSIKNHMSVGMGVRNSLRRRGFDERLLRVADLDDIWAELLRDAVAPREQGRSPGYQPQPLTGHGHGFKAADWNHAGRIHQAIHDLALAEPIQVGIINKPSLHQAVAVACRGGFPKPLLKSEKEWLRSLIIRERSAYQMLVFQIELELIVDGDIRWWRGDGAILDRLEERRLFEAMPFLSQRIPERHFSINLGLRVGPFRGLLEGLRPNAQ